MEPVVYFIKSSSGIKIGTSRDLEARFRHIQALSPEKATILGVVAGGHQFERAIHLYLKRYRLNGEWFSDCPEVRAAMDMAIAGELKLVVRKSREGSKHEDRSWVSGAIRAAAGPGKRGDRTKDAIGRAAEKLGISYWRAFDFWYRKSYRLTAAEQSLLAAASEQKSAA